MYSWYSSSVTPVLLLVYLFVGHVATTSSISQMFFFFLMLSVPAMVHTWYTRKGFRCLFPDRDIYMYVNMCVRSTNKKSNLYTTSVTVLLLIIHQSISILHCTAVSYLNIYIICTYNIYLIRRTRSQICSVWYRSTCTKMWSIYL